MSDCGAGYVLNQATRVCDVFVACTPAQFNQSGTCVDCDHPCTTCSGPGPSACLSCTLQLLENGTCVDACSASHYQNVTSCLMCPSDCKECAANADCTQCAVSGYVIQDGRCVASCASGLVPNADSLCGPPSNLNGDTSSAFSTSQILYAALLPVCVIVATVIVYLILRRIEPTAHNTIVFSVVFGLFDVITDALFVYSLFSTATVAVAVQYVALVAVVLPVTINLVSAMRILSNLAGKTAESNAWFSSYYPLAAFVAFIAAGHLGALLLLSSHLCGWAGFAAPLDKADHHRIKQLELVTLFVEDLPQLAIQIYVIQGYGVTPITIITLAASCFAVLFNLLQRFFYYLAHRNSAKFAGSTGRSDLVLDAYSKELGSMDIDAASSTTTALYPGTTSPGGTLELSTLSRKSYNGA